MAALPVSIKFDKVVPHVEVKLHCDHLRFFLCMRVRSIIGQPGNSSIVSRVKLRQTTIQLGMRAGFDDVGHCRSQVRVCYMPSLSTGSAVHSALYWYGNIQKRPLLSWEGETRLLDCEVIHQVGIDHQSQLPGFPPLTLMSVGVMSHRRGFLDVRRSCGGLRITSLRCDKDNITSTVMK